MQLPKHILEKMDYYTCQTFSQTTPIHSTITVILKKQWWQWWIRPIVININCIITYVESSDTVKSKKSVHMPDPEFKELNEQLHEYVKKPLKGTAKLSIIDGGKTW